LERKPGLRGMVLRARNGDIEALTQLLYCLYPLVKKYGRQMGYTEASSDLILWLLHVIGYYQS